MEMKTAHGTVSFPAYMPVTTFGPAYPLDNVIRPFLGRFASCLMVSYFYAKQMKSRPAMPMFIDSGGFAALLPGARILERQDGTGCILVPSEQDGIEDSVSPDEVLQLQMAHADFGAALDFPIPPNCPVDEAQRRITLTLANAAWAKCQPIREGFVLFGCVQGWSLESYVDCARELIDLGYSDLAIGGLVPRLRDKAFVLEVVSAIAALTPRLLHVFGVGNLDVAAQLFELGVTSVDSSSYVRSAADGVRWGGDAPPDPSVFERAKIALDNLAQGHAVSRQGYPRHISVQATG